MKKYSKHWKKSVKTKKQRKYRYNAPAHIRNNFLKSNLSKTLRKKHGKRRIRPRPGDVAKIMRGDFKGKTGKITHVNAKRNSVRVEDINKVKEDGTKVNVYIHTSNIMLTGLNTDDKSRLKKTKNKGGEK